MGGGDDLFHRGSTFEHLASAVVAQGVHALALRRPLDRACVRVVEHDAADDVVREGAEYVISTTPALFHQVQAGLRAAGIEPAQAEMSMIPRAEVDVAGREAERLVKLLGLLEELDDVQKVHSNANIDEKVLAEVG